MLIFERKMISEQLQKEALLYAFCQDFAVPNVIIYFFKQLAMDASVKHGNHDVVDTLSKYCTTCQFSTQLSGRRTLFRLCRSRAGAIDRPL